MLRSKLGLLGLCALALGLMAISASSAAAATEWLILDKDGKALTPLPAVVLGEIEEGTDGALHSKLVGIKLTVLCTAFTLEGTKLEGAGALTNGGKVTFTGCTVAVPTGNICTVKSAGGTTGTIASKEAKGQLQTNGEVKIEPKTGTAFAELVFEGKECTLPEGAQSVNGVLWVKDCEKMAELHLVKHLIEESKEHGHTLFIGKDTAEHLETEILGSAWAFLGGEHKGLAWGAMFP